MIFNLSAPTKWKSTQSGMVNNDNPEIHCAFMGHGPNPNRLGDQGQWMCHFSPFLDFHGFSHVIFLKTGEESGHVP